MGFRRLNFFTIFPSLFGKKTRNTLSESKEKGIDGNFAGDGWQNGGALVVDKGGKALLTFKQESPGEHVDPNDVLKALKIEGSVEIAEPQAAAAECTDNVCAMPTKKPSEPECTDGVCAMPKKNNPVPVCTDDAYALPPKS